MKFNYLHRRTVKSLEERTFFAKTSEGDIVLRGIHAAGEFNGLRLGAPYVERIDEIENPSLSGQRQLTRGSRHTRCHFTLLLLRGCHENSNPEGNLIAPA